jgi:hypothetical protein
MRQTRCLWCWPPPPRQSLWRPSTPNAELRLWGGPTPIDERQTAYAKYWDISK